MEFFYLIIHSHFSYKDRNFNKTCLFLGNVYTVSEIRLTDTKVHVLNAFFQMDSSNKKIFQRALQSRPKNPQLLCTCACLVANLATAQGAQVSSQHCSKASCTGISPMHKALYSM